MLNIYNYKNNDNKQNGDLSAKEQSVKTAKADVGRFEDVTGEFTKKQFEHSVWFSKHKVLLYKLTVGLMILLSLIFWGISLPQWGDYLINGIVADIKLGNDLVTFPDYTGIHEHYSPKPLQVAGVNTYADGVQSYDLVAEVANPNPNFIVYFDYYFTFGENKTPVQHSFLLAGENRPLVYFGLKGDYPNGVNLVLDNLAWKRVSTHDIKDAIGWQNDRLNFGVTDFSFTSPQLGEEGVLSNVAIFDFHNNSAYGYRDGEFIVGLMQAGSLAGVMPLKLENFKSQETRAIDLRNFTDNLLISDVQVFPVIDIYQKEAYLAPDR